MDPNGEFYGSKRWILWIQTVLPQGFKQPIGLWMIHHGNLRGPTPHNATPPKKQGLIKGWHWADLFPGFCMNSFEKTLVVLVNLVTTPERVQTPPMASGDSLLAARNPRGLAGPRIGSRLGKDRNGWKWIKILADEVVKKRNSVLIWILRI